jgi:hypothetical protein
VAVLLLEVAVMDLNRALILTNRSTLKVACPPPRHRGNFRKFLQTITHPLTAELAVLLFESAGVDLNMCTISINSSALEVACPPPGIGAKI